MARSLSTIKGVSEKDRKMIQEAEAMLGPEPSEMGFVKNLFWGNIRQDSVFPDPEPSGEEKARCELILAKLKDVDIVIEAVTEDIELKNEMFRTLDRVCGEVGRERAYDPLDGDLRGLAAAVDNHVRLAETYLLAAEAEWRQGKLAEAAEHIRDHMTKPVVAYVAGLSAPKGRRSRGVRSSFPAKATRCSSIGSATTADGTTAIPRCWAIAVTWPW